MLTYLNLSDLSRRELENLLLTVHSAYLRTLQVVRTHAEPGWKVRREVEQIAVETAARRTLTLALVRSVAGRQARTRGEVNAARWQRWQGAVP